MKRFTWTFKTTLSKRFTNIRKEDNIESPHQVVRHVKSSSRCCMPHEVLLKLLHATWSPPQAVLRHMEASPRWCTPHEVLLRVLYATWSPPQGVRHMKSSSRYTPHHVLFNVLYATWNPSQSVVHHIKSSSRCCTPQEVVLRVLYATWSPPQGVVRHRKSSSRCTSHEVLLKVLYATWSPPQGVVRHIKSSWRRTLHTYKNVILQKRTTRIVFSRGNSLQRPPQRVHYKLPHSPKQRELYRKSSAWVHDKKTSTKKALQKKTCKKSIPHKDPFKRSSPSTTLLQNTLGDDFCEGLTRWTVHKDPLHAVSWSLPLLGCNRGVCIRATVCVLANWPKVWHVAPFGKDWFQYGWSCPVVVDQTLAWMDKPCVLSRPKAVFMI